MVTYRHPAGAASGPNTPFFTAQTWYRITSSLSDSNSASQPSAALDVVNDEHTATIGAVNVAPAGNYSGQFWQLHPQGGGVSYVMNSMWQGINRRLEMAAPDPEPGSTNDSGGGNSRMRRPRLSSRVSPSLGTAYQNWRILPVPGEEGLFTIANLRSGLRMGAREGIWFGTGFGEVVLVGEGYEQGEGGRLETRWKIERMRGVVEAEFLGEVPKGREEDGEGQGEDSESETLDW